MSWDVYVKIGKKWTKANITHFSTKTKAEAWAKRNLKRRKVSVRKYKRRKR